MKLFNSRISKLLVACLTCSPVFSQFNFDYSDSIPVKIGTHTLLYPWTGGLNYVQLSDIDYDFDGDMDLFVFDKSRNNIRLFETVQDNGQAAYRYVYGAASYFPDDFAYRVALVDYDTDGRNDAFTYGIGGVKVYRNVGDATNGLQWQLVSNLLYSDYNGSYSNLFISSSDVPAYVDVDFDSDLDILTYDLVGERIEYHKNQSMELYGHNDSLVFVLKNECWGKFVEDQIDFTIFLNDQTSPCVGSSISNPELVLHDQDKSEDSIRHVVRHSGSTILAMDIDHSGVYDLIIGDVSSSNLNLLINGGSSPNTDSQMISQDLNFPSNTTPASVSVFPATFWVDVDHDQIKDLIVGANAKFVSENQTSISYYKNLGTNLLPNFSFRTKSFLQEDMIDAGLGSIPLFFDHNGDGLEDLFVANFYRYLDPLLKESAITFFQNTGTAGNPFLSYVEDDYLSLGSQTYGLRTVPTFGDVDGDLDQDVFLGLENGTLVFMENTAGSGNPAVFSNPLSSYADQNGAIITTDGYCFPQLFDLNNDGLLDLILGKKTGELMYYQNVGNASSPLFSLANDTLGGIDLDPITPDGYAAPHFFRYDDTVRLFLGAYDGKIHVYDQVDNHLAPGDTFHLVSPAYKGIDVEGYSSCYVNDLDHDGNFDLFVGGDLGGLMHFEHNINGHLNLPEIDPLKTILIYPNPSGGTIKLFLADENLSDYRFEITNTLGSLVCASAVATGEISLEHLPEGVYFLQLTEKKSGRSYMQKLIKSRN